MRLLDRRVVQGTPILRGVLVGLLAWGAGLWPPTSSSPSWAREDPPGASDAEINRLVDRLGADRYADREQAAARLRGIGPRAIPALTRAADSHDPEVADRASQLLRAIRQEMIAGPTLVRLDFRDRPLGEVVEAIRDRSGFEIVLTRSVDQTRRITLERPEPVPFWEALDLLGDQAELKTPSASLDYGLRLSPGALVLEPGQPDRGPRVYAGPLRLRLIRQPLDHGRVRFDDPAFRDRFAGAVEVVVEGAGRGQAFGRIVVGGVEGQGEVIHLEPRIGRYGPHLEIVAEPGKTVVADGAIRLTAALDQAGRDRRGEPEFETLPGIPLHLMTPSRVRSSLSRLVIALPLSWSDDPDQPITGFQHLAGKLPVTIRQPDPQPRVIPLAEAVRQTFEVDEFQITFLRFDRNLDTGAATIEWLVAPRPGAEPGQGGDPFGALALDPGGLPELVRGGLLGVGGPAGVTEPFEWIDDQGRPSIVATRSIRSTNQPGETRWIVITRPQAGAEAPTRVRLHRRLETRLDVEFEFRDLSWDPSP